MKACNLSSGQTELYTQTGTQHHPPSQILQPMPQSFQLRSDELEFPLLPRGWGQAMGAFELH